MATTLTYNIELDEGADIVHTFYYRDDTTNLPKDNTNCVVELQIKFEFLPSPVIYRSDTSAYILLGGSSGAINVVLPWLEIFNQDLGCGTYNLYLTNPQGIKTMNSKGFLTIVRSATPVIVPGLSPPTSNSNAGTVVLGPHAAESSLSVTLATDQSVITVSSTGGLGTLAFIPSGSVNGTAIGILPENAVGVRLYLSGSDSVTFTIADAQPSSAPDCTFNLTASTTGPNWDENLSFGQMIYLTEVNGTPKFRWI